MLFVHRDLRDVLASMKRTWKMKWSECAAMLDRTRDNYAFVRRHQDEEWLLVQAYETLTADLPAAVGEIASTLGVSLAEETRVEIAHECSIGRAETVTRDVRRQMVQNRDDLFGSRSCARADGGPGEGLPGPGHPPPPQPHISGARGIRCVARATGGP